MQACQGTPQCGDSFVCDLAWPLRRSLRVSERVGAADSEALGSPLLHGGVTEKKCPSGSSQPLNEGAAGTGRMKTLNTKALLQSSCICKVSY